MKTEKLGIIHGYQLYRTTSQANDLQWNMGVDRLISYFINVKHTVCAEGGLDPICCCEML